MKNSIYYAAGYIDERDGSCVACVDEVRVVGFCFTDGEPTLTCIDVASDEYCDVNIEHLFADEKKAFAEARELAAAAEWEAAHGNG